MAVAADMVKTAISMIVNGEESPMEALGNGASVLSDKEGVRAVLLILAPFMAFNVFAEHLRSLPRLAFGSIQALLAGAPCLLGSFLADTGDKAGDD